MTDDERLERIEQRAKGLGWELYNYPDLFCLAHNDSSKSPAYEFPKIDIGYTAAEALLSLYEPAPVVVIAHEKWDAEQYVHPFTCLPACTFHPGPGCQWTGGKSERYEPGPDCPGPAPDGKEHVLVLRDKVEDHEQK